MTDEVVAMRVKFECEKCGREYELHEVVRRSGREDGLHYYFWEPTVPCPKCSEPTYGPLTVENVAEALCFTAKRIGPWENGVKHYPGIAESYRDQARMVIRMIDATRDSLDRDDRYWPIEAAADPVKWMTSL